MKLKKLIAAGLMATLPFALGACAEEGDTDPVGDTGVVDEGLTEDTALDDGLTDDTAVDDGMTEDTMVEDTTAETTG